MKHLPIVLILAAAELFAPYCGDAQPSIDDTEAVEPDSVTADLKSETAAEEPIDLDGTFNSLTGEDVVPIPSKDQFAEPPASETAAANPEATPTPGPRPAPRGPLSRIEVLQFQAELIESAFSAAPNLDNRADLVRAYEGLVGPHCMPKLHDTLSYKGPALGEKCLGYLNRLLDLDIDNPMAACVRNGIDSPPCREGYLSQKIGVHNPSSRRGPALGGNLDALLTSKRNEVEVKKAEQSISLVETRFRGDSAKISENARPHLKRYLQLTCVQSYLKLEPYKGEGDELRTVVDKFLLIKPTPTPRPSLPASGVDRPDPFEVPMNENNPRAMDPKLERYTRTRLLLPQCRMAIDKARGIDPAFPGLDCYEFGAYSPNCIRAKRRERLDKVNAERKAAASGARSTPAKDRDIGRF